MQSTPKVFDDDSFGLGVPETYAPKSAAKVKQEMIEEAEREAREEAERQRLQREKDAREAYRKAFEKHWSEHTFAVVKLQSHARRRMHRNFLEKRSNMAKQRLNILNEFVETERSYVSSLSVCANVFIGGFRWQADNNPTPFFDRKQIAQIFLNWEQLMEFNSELLLKLEAKSASWTFWSTVSDVFIKMFPFLRLYIQYCGGYQESIKMINEAGVTHVPFKPYLISLEAHSDLRGLSIFDFLIMPVQRIPRYNMLMRELLKNTWANHPDYQGLLQAQSVVSSVADQVNNAIRQAQDLPEVIRVMRSIVGPSKIPLVVPNRRYVKDAKMFEVSDGQTKLEMHPVRVFLFNDMIMATSEDNQLKWNFFVEHSSFHIPQNDSAAKFAIQMIAYGTGVTHTLTLPTIEALREWECLLVSAIDFIRHPEIAAAGPLALEAAASHRLTMARQTHLSPPSAHLPSPSPPPPPSNLSPTSSPQEGGKGRSASVGLGDMYDHSSRSARSASLAAQDEIFCSSPGEFLSDFFATGCFAETRWCAARVVAQECRIDKGVFTGKPCSYFKIVVAAKRSEWNTWRKYDDFSKLASELGSLFPASAALSLPSGGSLKLKLPSGVSSLPSAFASLSSSLSTSSAVKLPTLPSKRCQPPPSDAPQIEMDRWILALNGYLQGVLAAPGLGNPKCLSQFLGGYFESVK